MIQRSLFLLCVSLLCVGAMSTFAGAQQYAVRYLDLEKITVTPAEIMLSPDYQTIIEFEDFTVEAVSSGRADQITVEIDEQLVRIRANKRVVNTDLSIVVGGTLVLFTLRVEPTSTAARRYLVLTEY
jgi:hypothetical protein